MTLLSSGLVLRRKIQTSQANRDCAKVGCEEPILQGTDYAFYELGTPKTRRWARRHYHLRCAPLTKGYAASVLEADLAARQAAGDFD